MRRRRRLEDSKEATEEAEAAAEEAAAEEAAEEEEEAATAEEAAAAEEKEAAEESGPPGKEAAKASRLRQVGLRAGHRVTQQGVDAPSAWDVRVGWRCSRRNGRRNLAWRLVKKRKGSCASRARASRVCAASRSCVRET